MYKRSLSDRSGFKQPINQMGEIDEFSREPQKKIFSSVEKEKEERKISLSSAMFDAAKQKIEFFV